VSGGYLAPWLGLIRCKDDAEQNTHNDTPCHYRMLYEERRVQILGELKAWDPACLTAPRATTVSAKGSSVGGVLRCLGEGETRSGCAEAAFGRNVGLTLRW
jgi:hypothetical protein